jgi:hypothetical protein
MAVVFLSSLTKTLCPVSQHPSSQDVYPCFSNPDTSDSESLVLVPPMVALKRNNVPSSQSVYP